MDCSGPDTIFTFYHNLRHVAGSFNILLPSLDSIISTTRTCALNRATYIGYDNVKDFMSTAIYLKLTSNAYFKSFPQAMAYVNVTSSNSNGFQLMYRIMELVHPRLRQAKFSIHK